jgi:hypothetical protein
MLSISGLEDKTLSWHILPGPKENVFEVEPIPEFQNITVPLAPDRGHLPGVTIDPGVTSVPAEVKQAGCHVQGDRRSDKLAQGRVIGSGNKVVFQIAGGLKPDAGDRNRRLFQCEESLLEPLNSFIQRQRNIMTRTPEGFKRGSPENEGRMNPEEVGAKRDEEVEGVQKAFLRVTGKADHKLDSYLEVPSLQPGDR